MCTSRLTFIAGDDDLRGALDHPVAAVLFTFPFVYPIPIPLAQINNGVVTIPNNIGSTQVHSAGLLLFLEGFNIKTGPFDFNDDQLFGVGPAQGQTQVSSMVTNEMLNSRVRGLNAREILASANGHDIEFEIEAYPHIAVGPLALADVPVRIYVTIELVPDWFPCHRRPLAARCTNFNLHPLSLIVDPFTLLALEVFKPLVRDEMTKIAQEEVDHRVTDIIEEEGGPSSTVLAIDSISGLGSTMEFTGIACAPLDDVCNAAVTTSTSLGFRSYKEMSHLRRLRDYFLRHTKKGTRYLEMYNKHKDEIRRLMAADRMLVGEIDKAVSEFIRCFPIETLDQGSASKKAISQLTSVLQGLSSKASGDLAENIGKVTRDVSALSGLNTKEVLQYLQEGN